MSTTDTGGLHVQTAMVVLTKHTMEEVKGVADPPSFLIEFKATYSDAVCPEDSRGDPLKLQEPSCQ